MWSNNILYFCFLIQILFISFYIPSRIVAQMKTVLEQFSPSEYPKLYPVSKDAIEKWIGHYWLANMVVLCVGLCILFHGFYTGAEQMLGFSNKGVVFAYFMLQYLPILLLEYSNCNYLKKMRQSDHGAKRKAVLSRRSFFDYVDGMWLFATLFSHLIFAGVIIFFMLNPFKGFGGLSNVLILFIMDVFFVSIVAWNIFGKKRNPHQSAEDRDKILKNITTAMFLTVNLVIIFIVFNLFNKAYGSPALKDTGLVVYFIVLSVISMRSMIVDVKTLDFDVYRDSSHNKETSA